MAVRMVAKKVVQMVEMSVYSKAEHWAEKMAGHLVDMKAG